MSAGKYKRGSVPELGKGSVQEHLFEQVEAHGGLCEHFSTPGKTGPPDCIITWPAYGFARIHFIETKTIGGKLESWQERDHKRRRKLGAFVKVLWTKNQVDSYVSEYGTART